MLCKRIESMLWNRRVETNRSELSLVIECAPKPVGMLLGILGWDWYEKTETVNFCAWLINIFCVLKSQILKFCYTQMSVKAMKTQFSLWLCIELQLHFALKFDGEWVISKEGHRQKTISLMSQSTEWPKSQVIENVKFQTMLQNFFPCFLISKLQESRILLALSFKIYTIWWERWKKPSTGYLTAV